MFNKIVKMFSKKNEAPNYSLFKLFFVYIYYFFSENAHCFSLKYIRFMMHIVNYTLTN